MAASSPRSRLRARCSRASTALRLMSELSQAGHRTVLTTTTKILEPIPQADECLILAETLDAARIGLTDRRCAKIFLAHRRLEEVDPDFAASRMRLVFAQQTADGGGCFSFYPGSSVPTSDEPRRSDNTVWQVYTMKNLVAETGEVLKHIWMIWKNPVVLETSYDGGEVVVRCERDGEISVEVDGDSDGG